MGYRANTNYSRNYHPPKLTGRRLTRAAAEMPMVTLGELQGSTAQRVESVNRTNINEAFKAEGQEKHHYVKEIP